MKKLIRHLALLGSFGLIASIVHAAPCDNSNPCQNPSFDASTQSGWTSSASGMSGMKCLNSAGSGNAVGSHYFFAASNSNLGATPAKGTISTTGTGSEVIGSFALNSGSTGGTVINGGVVQQLLGNQTYFIYVEACGSSEALDSTNCSVWVQIGSNATLPYPVSVFSAPVKPTDATINSIASRTNVPAADANNISEIQYEIDNLINSTSQTGILDGWTGNGTYTIDDSLYTAGFTPNAKYQYKGQVFYPYGVAVPTAGAQTEGSFWTTPENPGPVSASAVTHCSALITAENSNASTPNPTYTKYSLCATGVCQTSGRINGIPVPSDTVSATITGLTPGTGYTPNATALVGNQDGSQTSWNSSGQTSGTGFTTLAWGGSFTVGTITTNSAIFTISGLTGAGSIASWIIMVNGASALTGSGDPTGTHTLSGLNANTQYSVQIQLTETSGCSSTLPLTPVQFYTLPVAPTTPAGFGTTTATTIPVTWTDVSNNPAPGTTYDLQYSAVGASGPWTDFATNPAKVGGSAQGGTISGLNPLTTYWVQVRTVSASGNSANDSAFLLVGSVQTQDTSVNMSAITFTVSPSSISLSVTASGGIAPYKYHWSVLPNAGTSFTANDTTSANNTFMNYATLTSYTITVTATDNSGTGPGVGTQQVTVNPGQTPTTMDPILCANTTCTANGTTVVVGPSFGKSFNVIVRDQFGAPIPNQAVTWSFTSGNGAASNSPSLSSATVVTGVNSTLSPTTLQAALGSLSQTVSITVVASGPQFTMNPTITLNADGKTANVSALGTDSSPGAGAMNYAWTLESGPSALGSVVPNNSTSANNAVVTFTQGGIYVLRCTITDNFASQFADTLSTVVPQNLTSITVSPNNITVQTLQNQQFTATCLDQFNNAITPCNVTWSTSGGGNISGAGAFSSPGLGQDIKVTAASGAKSGFAVVNVISFDVSGAYAYPVPYKANFGTGVIHFANLGTDAKIRIYTTSGRKVFETEVSNCAKQMDCYHWPIKNSSGESIASGVYFYVIESTVGGNKKNGKLIIIQ